MEKQAKGRLLVGVMLKGIRVGGLVAEKELCSGPLTGAASLLGQVDSSSTKLEFWLLPKAKPQFDILSCDLNNTQGPTFECNGELQFIQNDD